MSNALFERFVQRYDFANEFDFMSSFFGEVLKRLNIKHNYHKLITIAFS